VAPEAGSFQIYHDYFDAGDYGVCRGGADILVPVLGDVYADGQNAADIFAHGYISECGPDYGF
jgi:hypothetical protein